MERKSIKEMTAQLAFIGLAMLFGASVVQGCSKDKEKTEPTPSSSTPVSVEAPPHTSAPPSVAAPEQEVCRDDYPVGLQECREKGQATDLAVSKQKLDDRISHERADARVASEKRVVKEALMAVQETESALDSIEDKESGAAMTSIKNAIGDLEILLAREPELANVPLDFGIETINMTPDLAEAKKIGRAAKQATQDGRFQEARVLLDSLTSEIRVTTTSLPLATYPGALKEAARLLSANDLLGAGDALRAALSTLVIEQTVSPIPLINTMTLIDHAKELALSLKPKEGSTAKGDEKRTRVQVLKALADAREQLKLAEALGYGSAVGDYEPIYDQIDYIENEVISGQSDDNLFAKLAHTAESLYEKISG